MHMGIHASNTSKISCNVVDCILNSGANASETTFGLSIRRSGFKSCRTVLQYTDETSRKSLSQQNDSLCCMYEL